MAVTIKRYVDTSENQTQVAAYQLQDQRYTGGPTSVITRSAGKSNRFPMMIYRANLLVGFFCLHVKDGPQLYGGRFETDILLRALSVDDRYRGQHIALQAMLALPQYVAQHFPGIQRIILAVNANNTAAQALYFKAGFRDDGQRRDSEIGTLWILKKDV
ncbi:hypothetical protein FC83_GL002920 [Agrilactobacillus composti DSM 18527 = JCM 14202]|uniref:N-acetyltransferase domain-containing protein n=1 Tax=Agrilactobacillus composti DSM 18527 = JCM 14202 TaxID=1423734 RepID=X0QPX0_9LACO|nr:GNAT family N-acetyltransferase [Agrilactobacillus composti]KRM33352.1 hypothetical protein FC83_GL002920 [Agrilactobacillus composti DSM 18527 = JCM 14202]GAF40665.1 acetyltransferase, GNAT family [Agrilactobacillus composti DSM 18527 = JCM 14202]